MSMLDGLHMDQRGDDVLPALTRFQQTDFRPRGLHLYARLGQHGRIYHHVVYSRVGAVSYHHRLYILLYILHDEAIEVRRSNPRQGVCYCVIGKSEQSESHHVFRPSDGFLDIMGSICRIKDIRSR